MIKKFSNFWNSGGSLWTQKDISATWTQDELIH
jgi:hypothetical protein